MALPAAVVLLGLAITLAPKFSIMAFLYGFCCEELFTMNTLSGSLKYAQASLSAVPHWPAPVSVVSEATPCFLA